MSFQSLSRGGDYYADPVDGGSPLLDPEMRADPKMRTLFKDPKKVLQAIRLNEIKAGSMADIREGQLALMGHARRLKGNWPSAFRTAGWLLVPGDPGNADMVSTLSLLTDVRQAQEQVKDGVKTLEAVQNAEEDLSSRGSFTSADLNTPAQRMAIIKKLDTSKDLGALGRLALLKHYVSGGQKGSPGSVVMHYSKDGKSYDSLSFEVDAVSHDAHVAASMEELADLVAKKHTSQERVIPVVYLANRVAEDAFEDFGKHAQKSVPTEAGDSALPFNMRKHNPMTGSGALANSRAVVRKAHGMSREQFDINSAAHIGDLVKELRPGLRMSQAQPLSKALRETPNTPASTAQAAMREIEAMLSGKPAAASATPAAANKDEAAGAPLPDKPEHFEEPVYMVNSTGLEKPNSSIRIARSYVPQLINAGVPEVTAREADNMLRAEMMKSVSGMGLDTNLAPSEGGGYNSRRGEYSLRPYSMNHGTDNHLQQTAFVSAKAGDAEVATQFTGVHEFGFVMQTPDSTAAPTQVRLPSDLGKTVALDNKSRLAFTSYLFKNASGNYQQVVCTPHSMPERVPNTDSTESVTHTQMRVTVPGSNTTGLADNTETKLTPKGSLNTLRKSSVVFTMDK